MLKNLGWPFGLTLAAIALASATIILIMLSKGSADPDTFKNLGPWGDFFGGTLNPILTFLTLLGVLVTIALQKVELGYTRDELRRSADALESQIRSLDKQNFESTFFQMLSVHNGIVSAIDLVNSKAGTRTVGRDCFRVFYTRLNKLYRENEKKAVQLNRSDDQVLEQSYKNFWNENQLDLGHYFRFLFNFIKFIKNNRPGDEFYIKLLRSQLSDQELLLLFYNCLSPQGQKFRAFAEEFALFDNMPVIRLLNREHIKKFNSTAFGDALSDPRLV